MESKIISGDFPTNAVLKPTGFLLRDISVIWSEGFSLKTENLKGKIERLELLDKNNYPYNSTDESLTPLEGGIIGGSVAGLNGFLAGYLSLPDWQNAVIFICYLKDGRHFIAISDYEMYTNLNKISLL
jgi:hypothetical protein